jgi:hypothetical protein
LVPALALGDEDPPLAQTKVLESEPQHLATAQAAEQHGLGHGPVPIGAQRRHQRLDLVGVQDARQAPHPAHERCAAFAAVTVAPGGQATWHRIGDHTGVTSDDEISIEARHRGEAPLDGRGRQSRLAVGDPHHLLGTLPRAPLVGHEAQHVLGGHVGGLLADDPEEHAQVMGIGPHRGRSGPT